MQPGQHTEEQRGEERRKLVERAEPERICEQRSNYSQRGTEKSECKVPELVLFISLTVTSKTQLRLPI